MNVDDIRNVVFDKAMRGYRMEEVDAFLAQVATEFEKMAKDKEDLEKKLYILAEKVDQYRNEEDTLKTALLNAQRMGESVIYEARQKAETIVYDANTKASQAKDEANQHVSDMEMQYNRLKAEVANFKSSVLTLYRQHIELLSQIPGEERAARRESAVAVKTPASAPAPETKKAQPAAKASEQVATKQDQEPSASKAKKAPAKEHPVAQPASHPQPQEEKDENYHTIAFDFDEEDEKASYDDGYDDEDYTDGDYADEQNAGYDDELSVPETPFDDEDDEDEEDKPRPSRPSDLDSYHDISLD